MQLALALRGARLTPALVVAAGVTATTAGFALRRRSRLLGAAALVEGALVATGAFAHWVEPSWIDTTFTELDWRGTTALRLALLTDLHAEPNAIGRIRRIVKKTNALRPDVVLLGGDFIEGLDADSRKLAALAPLRRLRAPLGTFAVLGNHDADDTVRRTVERTGIRVLANEAVDLPGGTTLVGLGDFREHETRAHPAFANVPEDAPTIVLAHEWRSLETPGVRRFDLALTGHTHGGQGCVPFTGICPWLEDDMKPFRSGLYEWPRGGRLYVSRGLGSSGVRARIGARPEIACIDLRPS